MDTGSHEVLLLFIEISPMAPTSHSELKDDEVLQNLFSLSNHASNLSIWDTMYRPGVLAPNAVVVCQNLARP